ncbi:MAG: 2-C-methyl-D-erythritol 2,4-cyclodiphosphate synthase [Planctomycetaceae bacterium]|nr:2-C-methyl-D-erythritol 2,4-cyclodiphosphate synthase [Planctomycetaceae bacterium]
MTSHVFRVGNGHDSHRLADGGPLVLGGISVPHNRHSVGHSDADVLLHAITDAILGAAAEGDIGEWFPDTAEVNRGRCSSEMLLEVWTTIQQHGYSIVNLDCTVFAQRPKLGSHKLKIRQHIAELLKIEITQIGLKAKTGEHVGPIGHEEAIAAHCAVLLQRTDSLV